MPSVLVVDDTSVDRCLVEGLLKRRVGFDVESVPDALTALDRVQARRPDVVVTDLQMPQMNGLDLVTILRERFPELPVVLITAHGSEALAVEAIEIGVASYVPKTQLVDRLLPTIDQILDAASADRGYREFQSSLQDARLRFVVGMQPQVLDHVTEVARGMAASVGLCDAYEQLRLAVALQGLFQLCFHAGNLELPVERLDELDLPNSPIHTIIAQRREELPYSARQLHVEFELTRMAGHFFVRHEGRPFDASIFADGTERRDLPARHFRGLVLLRAFATELSLVDDGQSIVMVRQRR